MIPTVQKIDLIDSALKRRFCDDVRKQQTPSYKPISCSVDDLDENFDGPESLEDQYLSTTRQKKNEPLHEHRKDGNVVIPKESHVFLRNSQLSSSRHERIVTNVNAVLKPSDRRCFQSRDSLRSSHIVNPSYQRSNLSVENYAPQVSTPHQSALSMAAGNPKGIPSKGNTCESSKIKFVGKVLVDSNRLIHNATSFTGSTKQFNINSILAKRASSNENLNPSKKIKTPSNHIPNVTSKSVRDKTKPETISKTDIQELLNRKSAHEVEAKEEWFENYSKRLDNLSKREYAIMKQNETTSIKVHAFHCQNCNLVSEIIGPLCRPKCHTVLNVYVTKRFYECSNCLKRDYTLGKSVHEKPAAKCSCGRYEWKVCGLRGSSQIEGKTPLNEKMVVSGTDWTSRKDLEKIKIMASNLR